MKAKKTNKANLEKRKPTLLLIGLVLSLAMVLESFEWLNGEYLTTEIESMLSAEIPPENIFEIDIIVPQKKVAVQQAKTKSDVVEVVKPDEVIVNDPIDPIKDDPAPEVDWDALENVGNGDGADIVEIEPIFVIVEEVPEFPGGEKALYAFLGEYIKYPPISAEAGSQGKAYVNFTIEKDGSITDVKTIGGGADFYCKKEAERVIKEMPNWKPGKQRGKKVRVSYTLPVKFMLKN